MLPEAVIIRRAPEAGIMMQLPEPVSHRQDTGAVCMHRRPQRQGHADQDLVAIESNAVLIFEELQCPDRPGAADLPTF